MNEETEVQDSQPDADEDTAENDSQEPSQDGTATDNSELASKNKQLFERAKKAEQEAKELRERHKTLEEQLKSLSETPKDESPKEASPDDPLDSFIQNYSVVQGLKPDELQKLNSEAKQLGVRVDKFLSSEAGKLRLENLRSEKEVEETTPSPSGPIRFNDKPIKDLSLDERKKLMREIGSEAAKNLK